MPELPDVELYCDKLRERLLGQPRRLHRFAAAEQHRLAEHVRQRRAHHLAGAVLIGDSEAQPVATCHTHIESRPRGAG